MPDTDSVPSVPLTTSIADAEVPQARHGVIALCALLAGQLGGGLLSVATLETVVAVRALLDIEHHPPAEATQLSWHTLSIVLGGAVACVAVSRRFVRVQARQSFRETIGWRLGSPRALAMGALLGITLAIAFFLLSGWLIPYDNTQAPSDLMVMARTPGFSRIIFAICALLVAPPLEEFLFRGMLYTGLARAWGPLGGATATTALFCLIHVPEATHYWPGLGIIALVSVVTIALRVRTGCLGPAIATHFAYNGVLVLASYLAPST